MTTTLKNQTHVKQYDLHPPMADLRAEVLQGLTQSPKVISPKFLYDKKGAELFDEICTLDEYYLTRTEVEILQAHATEISDLVGDSVFIEFGSGSSQKIRILLDAMPNLPTYIALDISKQHLQESCEDLAKSYPGLETIAICTDYMQPLTLPPIRSIEGKTKVAFFPGSSIGNLEPDEVVQFLHNTAALVGEQGGLLIGVDLKKSKTILEPAYDDAQGVSAAFALNLLTRINRELGTDFDLNGFRYQASYNPVGRIEMRLVSLRNQVVHFEEIEVPFQEGETLRTEHSYKYDIAEFQSIAAIAGFQAKEVWTDAQQLFSVHFLQLGKESS